MKEYYISRIKNTIIPVDEDPALYDSLAELTEDEVHKICIIVKAIDRITEDDVPDLIKNLYRYEVNFSIHNYSDLGRYWIGHMVSKDSEAANYLFYIDFNRLGKDLCARGVGTITPYGFLWSY